MSSSCEPFVNQIRKGLLLIALLTSSHSTSYIVQHNLSTVSPCSSTFVWLVRLFDAKQQPQTIAETTTAAVHPQLHVVATVKFGTLSLHTKLSVQCTWHIKDVTNLRYIMYWHCKGWKLTPRCTPTSLRNVHQPLQTCWALFVSRCLWRLHSICALAVEDIFWLYFALYVHFCTIGMQFNLPTVVIALRETHLVSLRVCICTRSLRVPSPEAEGERVAGIINFCLQNMNSESSMG